MSWSKSGARRWPGQAAVGGCLILVLALACPQPARAAASPAIREAVAGIVERMRRELPGEMVRTITVAQVERLLTPRERNILATEHVTFRVNVPVRVSVLRDTSLGNEPFWLREGGFRPAGLTLKESGTTFDVWQKDFPAGRVGLGIHSLTGSGNHYLVLVAPQTPGDRVRIRDLSPANLEVAIFKPGVEPYVDQPVRLKAVPPSLEGQLLIKTDTEREEDARLVGLFRWTAHPATDAPDQVVLTWSEDPCTTQTIQWRTGPRVTKGYVRYQKKADLDRPGARSPARLEADTTTLSTPIVLNDPVVHRHTAVLRGLQPDTTYVYAVGDGSAGGWTPWRQFTTAPVGPRSFSFVYLGDAQNGLDRWGALLQSAFRARPDAAFYIMAGDLVNRGAARDEWDELFHYAGGVYDSRPLVPALGNHDCQGGKPELYLKQFALPRNGPAGIQAERAYALRYGQALFLILDSNLPPHSQTNWLARQLARTDATWKFVVYHHPAYSSGGNRDNAALRAAWTPIFDAYHVDMALQGHDHAYLRTYPLKGGRRVASPKDGTVYLITFSGTKTYTQPPHDYTEVGFTKVPTYQVLDIQTGSDRLVYRAYDAEGQLRDEMVITK